MTWVTMSDVPNPIFDANGDPYSGAVLKAYLTGTTTSTSIAIDSSGSSPQTSITANANGAWEVSGNEIVPFIDRVHKWGIFANATDAAANTPFYLGPFDNIPFDSENTYDTVAAMVAGTAITGTIIQTLGYFSKGDGGGNLYEVVAAGTGTANSGEFFDLASLNQAHALNSTHHIMNPQTWGFAEWLHRDEAFATAGQTVFPYTFSISVDADIRVSRIRKGSRVELILDDLGNDGFSVSGAGGTGGNVTLAGASTVGDYILIYYPGDKTVNQVALQELSSFLNTRGGGEIDVPTGLFEIDIPVVIWDKVSIYGTGKATTTIHKVTTDASPVADTATLRFDDGYGAGGTAGDTTNQYPVCALMFINRNETSGWANATVRDIGTRGLTTDPTAATATTYGFYFNGMSNCTVKDTQSEFCQRSHFWGDLSVIVSRITGNIAANCKRGFHVEFATSTIYQNNYAVIFTEVGHYGSFYYSDVSGNACDKGGLTILDGGFRPNSTTSETAALGYYFKSCKGSVIDAKHRAARNGQ